MFWQVEEEFGSIMDLFQETGNQKNMWVKGESRLEIIMEMHGAAKRGIAKLGLDAAEKMQEEMWVRVKRDAMRSNHSYKEEIADLVDFVRNLSGGAGDPIYIHYLRNFIRTLKVERKVRGGLYGLLARAQIGVPNAAPQFRVACLQAMAGASDIHGSISRGKTKQIVPLHLAVVGRAISA